MSKAAELAELKRLLRDALSALDDWIHTYASEQCDDKQVAAAWARIRAAGGTLAYIAALRQRIREALK